MPQAVSGETCSQDFIDPDGKDAIVSKNDSTNTITISSNIYIYGEEASNELAYQYEQSLYNSWGNITQITINGTTYSIIWDINVENLGNESITMDFTDGKSNYFNVRKNIITSVVRNSHEGDILPIINNNNDMIHEFGHLLGLKDRYGTDKNDAETYRRALSEYEGNVMAEEAGMGIVEPMNVKDALYPVFNSGIRRQIYFLRHANSEIKRLGKEQKESKN